jgi:pyruvate formate lyase activating enzyme
VCFNGARKFCGTYKTPLEVFNEVMLDEVFYKNSGGGVTFSGGEPMLQTEFLVETAKLLKERGISVAIDTAGDVSFDNYLAVMPYVDYFLFDVKCISEDLHIKGTGNSNRRILENLTKLSALSGFDIIIRTPIIPNFNDNEFELNKIDEFLRKIRHVKHEKLQYHELGASKLKALL